MRRLPLSTIKFAIVRGGSHKGACPLVGEPPLHGGVGGTHPPRLPLGETGKGDPSFPSWLPQAVSFALRSSPFPFATAGSPCFHSHSFVELLAPVPVGCSQSCIGCCHLGAELNSP